MSQIKSKDTKIERFVFKEMRRRGVCFQKHYKNVRGTPDIALPKKKVAIFVDGSFWHGYRYPLWKGRLSNAYWQDKIERNRRRDQKTFRFLRNSGWKVLRIWEHQLKKNPEKYLEKIEKFLR